MGGGVIPTATEMRERELLERLGLDERASAEDVARTRNELQAFLASAPRSLRGWARRQATAADEAYALLSDPTAWQATGALPAASSRSASQPGGPATPPVRRATPSPTAAVSGPPRPAAAATAAVAPAAAAPAADAGTDEDDDAEFEAMLAEVTPSMHRDRIAPRQDSSSHRPSRASGRAAALPRSVARPGLSVPRAALGAAAVVAAIAIGFAIYQFGSPAEAAGPGATAGTPAPTAGLDEARVAALMTRIQEDPNDTAALLELGDAFFQVGQYDAAIRWLEQLVELEPNNVRGRLALGAAQFNVGEATEAEAEWRKVLEIDAENVEAHYDLGFLYLNATPPDYDGVRREWAEVVRLAPDTEIATVVKQHLDALAAMSPAPSANGSPAGSPAASSVPTDAPSAAPSEPAESPEPAETPEP